MSTTHARISLALLVALAVAGCGPGSTPKASTPAAAPAATPATTTAPTTTPSVGTVAGATVLATEEVNRYAAGDYAGAWDLWTAAGQKAFSRADYVAFHAACHGTGLPMKVENVRLEDPTHAVARISVLTFAQAYPLVFEGGRWRWQPHADDLADYKLGVKGLIAKSKAAGTCLSS